MRSMGSNALASYIVLACRPRPTDAPQCSRREFLNEMKNELPTALKHLQQGNIAPVDLAQAAIGPGMAVFSRYAKVVESSGNAMTVRTALALINQTLDEVLAEQEAEFDADTRWALAWFDQHGMEEGEFGVAETLSRAKNTAVNGLVQAGIVVARSGKVRLVKRNELPEDWDPSSDKRADCMGGNAASHSCPRPARRKWAGPFASSAARLARWRELSTGFTKSARRIAGQARRWLTTASCWRGRN